MLPDSESQPAPPADDSLIWLRPHPLTLLVEFVNAVKQMAFPIILVLFSSGGGVNNLMEGLVVLVPLAVAGARFLSTRYAIDQTAVFHRYGVFKRTEQVLPRVNVQNVATRAQLMARLTNLVELQISDASAEGDINLRLLSQAEAERLTALLRSGRGGGGPVGPNLVTNADGTVAPEPPRPPLVQTPTRMLVRASIGNGLAVGPVVTTVVALFVLIVVVLSIGVTSIRENIVLIGGAAVPLLLLSVPSRILTPLFRLAGFTLWADPDRIRTKAGLFTEQKTAARRERVQLVHVERHAAMRALGVERVRFATADLEGFEGSATTFLSPGIELDSWPMLASTVLGHVELTEADLQRVSPLTQRRSLVRFMVLAGVLVVAAIALAFVGWIVITALLVATAAAVGLFGDWYSRRRFERLGYAVGASQVFTRTGAIDETFKILRKEKVQSIRLERSYFQRRLGLASLRVGTAGSGALGAVVVVDLPVETAEQLAHHLATASAATRLRDTI